MIDERGLSAFIFTLHPNALLLAALIGALLSAAFMLVLMNRSLSSRALLGLVFFVGSTVSAHVVISALSDLPPVDIEVVRAR